MWISYEQQGFQRGKIRRSAARGRPWKGTDFLSCIASSGLSAYPQTPDGEGPSALDHHTLAARRIGQDASASNVVGVENVGRSVQKHTGDNVGASPPAARFGHAPRRSALKGPAWHAIEKAGKEGRGFAEDDEEKDI